MSRCLSPTITIQYVLKMWLSHVKKINFSVHIFKNFSFKISIINRCVYLPTNWSPSAFVVVFLGIKDDFKRNTNKKMFGSTIDRRYSKHPCYDDVKHRERIFVCVLFLQNYLKYLITPELHCSLFLHRNIFIAK